MKRDEGQQYVNFKYERSSSSSNLGNIRNSDHCNHSNSNISVSARGIVQSFGALEMGTRNSADQAQNVLIPNLSFEQ